MTALHKFIRKSIDIQGLREILISGENPNSKDRAGRTSLHIAVLKSERNPQDTDRLLLFIRELIHFGAHVNEVSNIGKTPLHFAVACRNYKMIEMLLQENADINQKDIEGYAALHFATSTLRFRENVVHVTDIGIVKLLLKYDPELDIQTRRRKTALIFAVQNNDFLIVRELLKNNASGNLHDSDGMSAMHYALLSSEVNLDIVLELVSHGCSFNMSNPLRSTPMTLYSRRLINAPRAELEKAKFVFKLYIFAGNLLNSFQQMYIRDISKNRNIQLSRYIQLCERELGQMLIDTFSPNFRVFDIALRGVFYRVFENSDHIPLEVYDKLLNKLIRRQYPLYCDLIATGICRPYLNQKFAEWFSIIRLGNRFLNFDTLCTLSSYLSNIDMLNMIIAISIGRKLSWLSPRFMYPIRWSVL